MCCSNRQTYTYNIVHISGTNKEYWTIRRAPMFGEMRWKVSSTVDKNEWSSSSMDFLGIGSCYSRQSIFFSLLQSCVQVHPSNKRFSRDRRRSLSMPSRVIAKKSSLGRSKIAPTQTAFHYRQFDTFRSRR